MRARALIFYSLIFLMLSGCSGGGSPNLPSRGNASPTPVPDRFPIGPSAVALTTADEIAGGPCSVSVDGLVWYSLPSGSIPPIDFTRVNCASAAKIDSAITPALPSWSRPSGPTNAIFVATSLQEDYSFTGMQAIERVAESAGIPVTWMIGNDAYLAQSAYYNQIHASNGDDVELEDNSTLYQMAEEDFPWFAPAVSVEGAGHERNIQSAIALGNSGFWGITWNSHGTDGTSDEGAPWGTYCADLTSYKRPSPTGDCSLVAFEWTARDLTRAYLADTSARGYSAEAAFSTDPDDILDRAKFSVSDGAAYERAIVDSYAAAGVSQPLVMMSQQEPSDEGDPQGSSDDLVLGALYQEAIADGMQVMTLRQALAVAKTFSAQPRAIAFPYIGGGMVTEYNGVPFTPATIDFHDDTAGMTFIAGHTLPARLFEYPDDPASSYTQTLAETLPSSATYPTLVGVNAGAGSISFTFQAPHAIHFGVALWTDPSTLGLSGANVTHAGHAGVVVTFDLPAGRSTQNVSCGSCTSTTFHYST